MKATIWHNPMCGTSRKTLDILNESGADVTVIEYLGEPYTREKLEQHFASFAPDPNKPTIRC